MGKIKNPSRWMSKGFSIIEVISAIIILNKCASADYECNDKRDGCGST